MRAVFDKIDNVLLINIKKITPTIIYFLKSLYANSQFQVFSLIVDLFIKMFCYTYFSILYLRIYVKIRAIFMHDKQREEGTQINTLLLFVCVISFLSTFSCAPTSTGKIFQIRISIFLHYIIFSQRAQTTLLPVVRACKRIA